jgi:hypothetical protein
MMLLSAFLIMGTGCRVQQKRYIIKGQIVSSPPAKKAPPGQLKKATGTKSAKDYAPGQTKKRKKK